MYQEFYDTKKSRTGLLTYPDIPIQQIRDADI